MNIFSKAKWDHSLNPYILGDVLYNSTKPLALSSPESIFCGSTKQRITKCSLFLYLKQQNCESLRQHEFIKHWDLSKRFSQYLKIFFPVLVPPKQFTSHKIIWTQKYIISVRILNGMELLYNKFDNSLHL